MKTAKDFSIHTITDDSGYRVKVVKNQDGAIVAGPYYTWNHVWIVDEPQQHLSGELRPTVCTCDSGGRGQTKDKSQ